MILRHSVPTGRCLGVLFLLVTSSCIGVDAIGVNYGTVANNLPNPTQVVQLLQTTYISKVKLYTADSAILSAFANSGIDVVVGAPNDEIVPLAASESYAQQWVTNNVASHLPSTNIITIVVGNEVLTTFPNVSYQLVPAMQNLHTGLVNLGLADKIKVSTPNSFGVLDVSYPPSGGSFRTDLSGPVFAPMLDFLTQTGSNFMINAYPYFGYRDNSRVPIAYALFEPTSAVVDPNTGLRYDNLFDAQVDAAYAAMAKLGHQDIKVTVSESGWPSFGDASEVGVSVTNAQTYNANLLKHINSNSGTPGRPGVPIDTFVFALFNENQKPGPGSERNFGLFFPDRTSVYNVGLTTNSNGSTPPPMVFTPSPPPPSAVSSPPPPSTFTPSSPPPPFVSSSPPPSANPPPPFVASSPPPSSGGTPPPPSSVSPPPFTATPPPPYTAPPPPYPVPHVPPSGPSPSSPPPGVLISPPPPAVSITPSPPAVAASPPPPSFFNPPPGSSSPPPSVGSPPPPAGSPPFIPSPSPPPAGSPPFIPSPSPPPAATSPPPASPPPADTSPPPAEMSPPPTPPAATAPPGTPPAPPGEPSGPNTWCVAKPGSPADDLVNALNYACGEGGADCTQIQSGQSCFNPNTLFSHASFAFSTYYAANGRNYWNCFFGNSSLITITNPILEAKCVGTQWSGHFWYPTASSQCLVIAPLNSSGHFRLPTACFVACLLVPEEL